MYAPQKTRVAPRNWCLKDCMGVPFGGFRTFSLFFFAIKTSGGWKRWVLLYPKLLHPQIPHPFQDDSAWKEAMELVAPMALG